MNKKLQIAIIFLSIGWNINAQNIVNGFNVSGVYHSPQSNSFQNQNSIYSFCDTVFSFPILTDPSGLTYDKQDLWYVTEMYIYKVSTNGTYL